MNYETMKPKIKIFGDEADIKIIRDLRNSGLIDGITTNPTLMKKSGIDNYEEYAKSLLSEIGDMPISFEVYSDDFMLMEREAKIIANWGKNVNVKIPITNSKGETSIPLIKKLSSEGLSLNITAILTIEQVKSVSEAISDHSNTIISIFAGRIADTGRDPMEYMKKASEILKNKKKVQLLWASTREIYNIFQAEMCNCNIITVTTPILKKMKIIGMNLEKLSLDTVIQFYNDAKNAGYKL